MTIETNEWKQTLDKVHSMSDESLLAVWEALGTRAAWLDNHYSENITLDEWADLVHTEIEIRQLAH